MGVLEGLFAAGAALFSAISATTVGSALFKAAVGVGINLGLGQLLGKKQKRDAQPPPRGLQAELATGADTPRDVAFGRVATRGQLTWFLETGPNNRDFNGTYVLSDGWCHSLVSVLVDGVAHNLVAQTVTGSEHARYHIDGFGSTIVLRWHDGRPGQAADTDMVAVSGGEITENDVADGLCYVAATIVDVANNFQALPELMFVFDGYRLYDLRQDSSVGGSGDQRFDDPSTWAPGGVPQLHNPMLMLYNYGRGIRAGSEAAALGGFASDDGLIRATVMVAANACDESVALPDAGSEPRYEASMIVKADGSDHRSKVAPMLQAMAGHAVESAGRFGILPGTAQTPVVTFTDDDVLWDEGVEWSRLRTRDERINQVQGQHLSEAAGWQLDDYPGITNAAARIEDGEDKIATFDQPHLRSPTQAQRTGSIRLEESRYGKARVALPMPFILLDAGDWVRWNSARYGDHLYWIDDIEQGADYVVRCALQRTHASVYGAPTLGTYTPPAAVPGPPALPTTVANFDVDQVAVSEENNIPALVATWDAPDDARVDAVVVEYRVVGSLASQKVTDLSPEDGQIIITGLAPGVAYEARATIRTTPLRNTQWTAWQSATTLVTPVVPTDNAVSLSALGLGLQGVLASLNRNLGDLEEIVAADAVSGSLEKLERYTEDGEIRALVSRAGEVARALVAEETIARTSAVEALAAQSLLVQAELDGSTATGLMALQSAVSDDGLTTSFGVLLRAETDGAFEEAGMSFEVVSDGQDPATLSSRVAFAADSFVFDNGFQPFTITSDGVFLKDIYFERLRSSPSITAYSIDINALNGSISVTTAA
jgi:hypothetical protein